MQYQNLAVVETLFLGTSEFFRSGRLIETFIRPVFHVFPQDLNCVSRYSAKSTSAARSNDKRITSAQNTAVRIIGPCRKR